MNIEVINLTDNHEVRFVSKVFTRCRRSPSGCSCSPSWPALNTPVIYPGRVALVGLKMSINLHRISRVSLGKGHAHLHHLHKLTACPRRQGKGPVALGLKLLCIANSEELPFA